MKKIWQVIQSENLTSKHLFNMDMLNKKYTIFFKGVIHERSFIEVASTRRAKHSQLSLDEPKRSLLFFKAPRTTSEVMIEDVISHHHSFTS